jgi:hypothetical protein
MSRALSNTAPDVGVYAIPHSWRRGLVSSSTEPHSSIARVLVIAADPSIESLVGELVAFAGHRPVYDVTSGAAGESVRRVRPDITLLDTSLDRSVIRACLSAADEVGSQPVLMSSTASSSELGEEARIEGRLFFPLPGGPKPLGKVLARAMASRRCVDVTAVPNSRASPRSEGSLRPALCAAISSVARARAMSQRAEPGRGDAAERPRESHSALAQTRRGYMALRAAVADYACQLRDAHIAEEAAIVIVHDAIVDCAVIVGAESSTPTLLRDSELWARTAYKGEVAPPSRRANDLVGELSQRIDGPHRIP